MAPPGTPGPPPGLARCAAPRHARPEAAVRTRESRRAATQTGRSSRRCPAPRRRARPRRRC
eukprot:898901-Lingulodinium_polyedra.AAC.1